MSPQIRSWLELFFFASNIVIAVSVVYGLKQIKLLKKDIRLRNERAAKEKSIEYGRRYLRDYVDLHAVFFSACKEAKLGSYAGPIGDFTSESVLRDAKVAAMSTKRYLAQSWLPAINELEALSAAFTAGVADEETGFRIFGRSFCGTVEHNYDIIALSRSTDKVAQGYWYNIVELYRLWSPRLQEAELRWARDSIESRIAAIASQGTRIPPIGTE
jgi:hypothetical protein